jgi:hypothetical protein
VLKSDFGNVSLLNYKENNSAYLFAIKYFQWQVLVLQILATARRREE